MTTLNEDSPDERTTAEQSEQQHLKSSLDFATTKTDSLAVTVTEILGSMRFLVACLIFFTFWILLNLKLVPIAAPFDPFPFPILEMVVSLFAIFLSVSVLINQNRQGKRDKIRQQVEFEVNVRAEEEITKMLILLHDIHKKLGLDSDGDIELEQMKEQTDIKEIHLKLSNDELSQQTLEESK